MRGLLFDEWWESDSESDTTLESSDESDLDILQRRVDENQDEPRRIRKSRKVLLSMLLSTFTIVKRSRSCHTAEEPDPGRHRRSQRRKLDAQSKDCWEGLPRSMDDLSKGLRDRRVKDVAELSGGLRVFDHFANTHLVPCATDKKYIRHNISRSEAKSVPPFLKQLEKLRGSPHYPQTAILEADRVVLDSTAPEILCRMALLSLSDPTNRSERFLNLSRLPWRDVERTLDETPIEPLFSIFGVNTDRLRALSLAGNDLTGLPAWRWSHWPNLASLDLSKNPQLASLPIKLMLLPDLNTVRATITRLVLGPSSSLTGPRLLGSNILFNVTTEPPRGVARLADIAAATLLDVHFAQDLTLRSHCSCPKETVWTEYGLPHHLVERLDKSYRCEMCNRFIIQGSAAYIEGSVQIGWMVSVEEGEDGELTVDGTAKKQLRVEGKVCTGCLRYLTGIGRV